MQQYQGLSQSVIAEKRLNSGYNELVEPSKPHILTRILEQFSSVLVLLLFAASIVAFLVGEQLDSFFILAIILLNAFLGFYQEYKAEKAIDALRSFTVSTARVVRDSQEVQIPSRELLVGDIVILDEGTRVPADGIILESVSLEINESSLTGESLGVAKSHYTQIGEPTDEHLVYLGTQVTRGHGVIEVREIGMDTRFGKITATLAHIPADPTPLQKNLSLLGKTLSLIATAICVVLFIVGYVRGIDLFSLFLTSVSLAVAAIPEGLPAIVTITLGLGVSRLAARHAIIRKLSSIETLGSTQIICTDKTGTLTTNDMRVRKYTQFTDITESEIVRAVSLCNTSTIVTSADNIRSVVGDTTEGALLYWVEEKKYSYSEIRAESPLIVEFPFDSAKKIMTVITENDDSYLVYSKGAPEVILSHAQADDTVRRSIEHELHIFAQTGLRTIAVGVQSMPKKDFDVRDLHESQILSGMTFACLFGIADPPRVEISDSLARARAAGVETIMITGDNPVTAAAIGREIGLLREGELVWSGDQLRQTDDATLLHTIDRIRIFSRTAPEDKLRIVSLLQKKGYLVAATGDGVNDALALKKADIGIAMGITGTDVAKEASDMILADDNYSTIISAIEEGRRIYQNIVKAVHYLLACNLSEIVVITTSILLFDIEHMILIPVQVLWINLVTDGLPALALARDPIHPRAMSSHPRSRTAHIVQKKDIPTLVAITIGCAAATLGAYWFGLMTGGYFVARLYAFNTLVISQCISLLVIRKASPFSNIPLLLIVILTIGLQLIVSSLPFTQELFQLR